MRVGDFLLRGGWVAFSFALFSFDMAEGAGAIAEEAEDPWL